MTVLLSGSILKKVYKINKLVKKGFISTVYVIEHIVTNELYIMKEFYPSELAIRDTDNQTVLNRLPSNKKKFNELKQLFLQEANILQSIDGQHVAKYIEHFELNGTAYIVMQQFEGTPLDQYVAKNKNCAYIPIFLTLVETLNRLHRQGIIHRDIKPSNILINPDGTPCLIDFGSAIYYRHTKKTSIVTSKNYSPLELYSSEARQTPKADIYSLNATLYYVITKKTPHDISERLVEDVLLDVRTDNPNITYLLSKIMRWSFALRQEKRCFSLKFIKLALLYERIVKK